MTTYIVKDKDGREVWRGPEESRNAALRSCGRQFDEAVLLRRAGYTVEEEVEVIVVPVEDILAVCDATNLRTFLRASDRLRALVEKHRSGK